MPEPISSARRLGYALGNPGYQLSDRIVVAALALVGIPIAGLACLLSVGILAFYPERAVLAEANTVVAREGSTPS